MKKILIVNPGNNSDSISMIIIGPMSIADARTGQKNILDKMPPGTATVIIGELQTLDDYLATLG